MKVPSVGPLDAKIMIVGEAPGAEEVRQREPFVGASGVELTRMLHEAGILRSECFITNAVKYRPDGNDISNFISTRKTNPPEGFVHLFGKFVHKYVVEGVKELDAEIENVKPQLILCFGNTALWAVTHGKYDGISKWRGSQIEYAGRFIVPTYHPAAILRQWDWRAIAVSDLKRARMWRIDGKCQPRNWHFVIRPSFDEVMLTLDEINRPGRLAVDLETRGGHIACCGIAWSEKDAISIPFMCVENDEGYFDVDQEMAIVLRLREILTRPGVEVVGQNFAYDAQYINRYWRFVPNVRDDTLVAQGLLWPGLPKSLDFLSSMYCQHHLYWKDDGKLWDPRTMSEDQLWAYNCVDACKTYEIIGEQRKVIEKLNLTEQYAYLMKLWFAVLKMMIRGVRIDSKTRQVMAEELKKALDERDKWFEAVLGHPLNPKSSKQMKELFYEDLRAPIQRNRKTGNPTLNDDALSRIAQKVPILSPLVQKIQEYRSIGVFLSTFVSAPADVDDRMRCSYNIVGTETFRFNSSENPFGSGTNLQNIPKGDGSLPNVRRIFTPDPGYTIFDADLDRADLQVVVWESDDAELKQMLREGVDVHEENAKLLGVSRQLAKVWVHGTNYGGSPRTMAINCGITVHQAELMQRRWFEAHPGIKAWHDRVLHSLQTTRSVSNRFGFRRFYFDRIEGLLPEALAWIPQSTVACVINKGLLNISLHLPQVEILLQVHDSLVFQIPTHLCRELLPRVRKLLQIEIPYPDPLVIPVGLKASEVSWGDVKERGWNE